MTTPELIREALNGSQDAYTQLYNQEYPYIKNQLNRMTYPHPADDLIQETFIQGFKELKQFKGNAKFSTWLTSIARNLFLMSKRRKSKYNVEANVDLAAIPEHKYCTTVKHRDVFLSKRLEGLISDLSQGQREAFMLHTVFGCTFDDTADYLGITKGTVKSNDHRARQKLLKGLNKLLPVNKRPHERPNCIDYSTYYVTQ